MTKSRSEHVRRGGEIPPGVVAEYLAAAMPRRGPETPVDYQVWPDTDVPKSVGPFPSAMAMLMRDWDALRRGLESAALALHAMTCDVSVQMRECGNPMCVYRVGLLDRTGGSVPDGEA